MADITKISVGGTVYDIKDETARSQAANKVDKVEGKGLSANDYTDEDKAKLDSLSNGANITVNEDTLVIS